MARSQRSTVLILLALGCLFTVLNAAKPLHIDDPFMYRVAEQIVSEPLDPYGFDVFWLQWPQPVYEELTPPVTPYWWAAGLALFGDRPLLWHLWLLPYGLMLAWSVHALLRRFARGIELPLTAAVLVSPALLPGFNLMQDVPAVALGLTALALYLVADERRSVGLALAAGLVAGLATQAKYTAVAILAAILLLGLLRRRLGPALAAVAVALGLFFAWEGAMTLRYGRGMFFNQVEHGLFWLPRWLMLLPLVKMLGATLAPLTALGLAAMGAPRRVVSAFAVVTLALFAGLAFAPLQSWLFPFAGSVACAVLAASAAQGLGVGRGSWRRLLSGRNRVDLFLALWFLCEVGVYFGASPFPAVRRVLGVVVVATLILARRAAVRLRRNRGRGGLAVVTATAILLGLGYWAVDLREAAAQRRAVVDAVAAIGTVESDATVWYVGHWGFQFYAERAGMRPVVPDGSLLRRGDWLVVPWPVDQQEIRLDREDATLERTLEIADFPPIRTGYGYYGGSTPLAHDRRPRLITRVYRIRQDLVPPSDWPVSRLTDWALRAGGRTAAAAAPALQRVLAGGGSGADRALAARGLAEIAPQAHKCAGALAEALGDGEAEVRYWAALGLGRVGPGARAHAAELERLLDDPVDEVRQAAERSLRAIRGAEGGAGTTD